VSDTRMLEMMEEMETLQNKWELLSWYGKMTEIGGKKASNLVQAFLMVF